MPHVALNGVELFYEITGDGPPVVFCHEFAGDYRAWEPQVRAFARLYQCITYSHRGFPPSSVPTDPAAYSQDLLIDDLLGLLDHLGLDQTHLVGFSMGGSLVLNFALRYPARCRSIVVVGTGAGTTNRQRFEADVPLLGAARAGREQVIGGDAITPRAEGALPAERPEVGDDLDQDLLRRVRRVLRVPEHA